ncbi:ferritin-like domain-containing protein [Catellatospora bangladeshensis]|uniref:ferritin-like domain-containing protein n=1 Tax=Catellatospora bangladeshensis TaxID=310355 RepID=UPI00361EE0AE
MKLTLILSLDGGGPAPGRWSVACCLAAPLGFQPGSDRPQNRSPGFGATHIDASARLRFRPSGWLFDRIVMMCLRRMDGRRAALITPIGGPEVAETTTLKWRQHQLSPHAQDALRSVTGLPRRVPAPPAPAEPAPAEADRHIQLPDLPATAPEKAATLLRVAAQIEHALMVQYLYAGYSFTLPQREILDVAIEEMSHLLTVQNLLRLVGEAPHLHRQDYGPPFAEDERLFPFDLRLEPLSHLSLAKYTMAESPAVLPAEIDPDVFAHIEDLATGSRHEQVNRVGTLYALLGAVFGSEALLHELAATGDPWYVAVDQLAAEAATFYGSRDALHLPDSAFHPASAPDQASDPEWDRSVEKSIDEFRVHVAANRREALTALRDIGLQGEGPSVVATENAHFRRFYNLFLRFFGADGTGTNPPPG